MKIFAVIPTRNDAWILPTVLGTVSLWADQIIVADENSWDNTKEICKKFPKVRLLRFEPKEFNESNRRQVLLEAVRQFDGQNIVFALDSDEIITAEILKPQVMESFIGQMRPGMSAKLQWIMLWKNTHQYRFDDVPEWSVSYKPFVYWDDRKANFNNVKMHSSRVPESTLANSMTFSGFKVLHYAFADWQRMMAKHTYYLVLEKAMGSKQHPYLLNRKYRWFYFQPKNGVVIKDVPRDWVEPYKQQGVFMGDFSAGDLYWYDSEVLRFFFKFGVEKFKHLNIWDVDWNTKLQIAREAGEKGLPKGKIDNIQPWYDKLYYKYCQEFLDQGGPFDGLKKIIKY